MVGTSPRRAGSTAQLLTHLGMALAAMAFASWWTTHTVYDTTRTRRIAAIVLTSPELRSYVADKIAPVIVQALPPGSTPATSTALLNADQLATGISDALGRPEVQQGLADLAKIPAVSIPIPQQAGLSAGTGAMRSRWPWYALGSAALLIAAIVVTGDRRATLQLIGRWLIGISVVQLLVLYVVPVWIVPRVTSNPWADLVASVIREWGATMITGLAVLAAGGVVCVLADHLVPSNDEGQAVSAPPAPPAPC